MRLKKQRRKQAQTMWRRLARRRTSIAIAAACGCAALLAGALVWQAERASQAVAQFADTTFDWTGRIGFAVDEIFVAGRRRVPASELRAAIGVTRGAPVLAIDLDEVRARVEALGWVKRASIARRLPDVLRVAVVEREPLALWQHDDVFAVIGRDGEVITRHQVGAFAYLPQVVGADAAAHAGDLLRMVAAAPRVAERFDAAVRVSGRRWDLRLDNDVVINLPANDVARALLRADRAQANGELFDRDITAVDLRAPDRMFVRVGNAGEILARDQR